MASNRTAFNGACEHDGGMRCPKGTPNCDCRLNTEIATLRAERDRYRQGLIDIVRYEGWQSEAPAAKAMGDIARRALTEADL